MHWLNPSDTLGLLALILLALPVLSAASSADRRERFLKLDYDSNVDPRLRAAKRRLDQHVLAKVRQWSPWHSGFLYAGYLLALASYLVKMF